MSFKINSCYCEKLNINQYLNGISEGITIRANIDFKTKIFKNGNNVHLFKIYYFLESDNTPISLDWVGVVVIEAEKDDFELDNKDLLQNGVIRSFIEESFLAFPKFFHGTLPSFERILESVE